MALLRIAEVFGHAVENTSPLARSDRANRRCPFRNGPCTKVSKTNPLGICTFTDGSHATSVCPVRFIDSDRIFVDAARHAFGDGVHFAAVPEIRILRVEDEHGRKSKIGKIDYLLAKLNNEGRVHDFAALEVQAVYFSGREIRSAMDYYLTHQELDPNNCERRLDYRSSAQKRLMPQLRLKVPVFRRWGKKFFVVVDSLFFTALPAFRSTSAANSEITWLSYPIELEGSRYRLKNPTFIYSEFDEVLNALREGEAPEPKEIMEILQSKVSGPPGRRPPRLNT